MLDEKTKKFLDKVAEEWVIDRKRLEVHCPEIKENEVEWIEAIKTIVVEANIWYRFIKKNEITSKTKYSGKDKSNYNKGSGKSIPITVDTKLTFGKYSGKDNDPNNPARSLNEIAKFDMDYIEWLSKNAKNSQLRKLANEMIAKSKSRNDKGGNEWEF